MTPSSHCLALVKAFEGFSSRAYRCPAGVWTIGYGTTIYPDGRRVKPRDTCTREQAETWLVFDLRDAVVDVLDLVKVPLNQNQFDALVSFVYNVGSDIDEDAAPEGLGDSTLLRKLNTGDYGGAADEFLKWVNGGGKKLPGLVRRRKAERELFLS